VLRACRRLLRRGGRTSFTTIVISEGLTKSDHRRAARLGPRAVATTRPIRTLMRAARFEDVEVVDVTPAFIATTQAWFDAFAERETELRPLLGTEYDDRQSGRLEMIEGAQEGLLQRLLVSGAVPTN
jgi:cyclopropane fatty-acyl-phospholipid synthase-like methyltransferase